MYGREEYQGAHRLLEAARDAVREAVEPDSSSASTFYGEVMVRKLSELTHDDGAETYQDEEKTRLANNVYGFAMGWPVVDAPYPLEAGVPSPYELRPQKNQQRPLEGRSKADVLEGLHRALDFLERLDAWLAYLESASPAR